MTQPAADVARRWYHETWSERRPRTSSKNWLHPTGVAHAKRGHAVLRAYRDDVLGTFPDLRMEV
jgi:hypothetical protein